MPFHPPGKPVARWSAQRSIGKQNLLLAVHQIPLLAPSFPVFHNQLRCQTQHAAQRIIIGEFGLVLGNLPELPVWPFNNISRIHDFTDIRWAFKEYAQVPQLSSHLLKQDGYCFAICFYSMQSIQFEKIFDRLN